MKFVPGVTRSSRKENEPIELFLEFVDQYVYVSACQQGTDRSFILFCLEPDGTYQRVRSVSEHLGFQTDDKGRIKEKLL